MCTMEKANVALNRWVTPLITGIVLFFFGNSDEHSNCKAAGNAGRLLESVSPTAAIDCLICRPYLRCQHPDPDPDPDLYAYPKA